MRRWITLFLLLAGCAGNSQDKWPSLAPRAGEVSGRPPATGACAGCGQDSVTAAPAIVQALPPLPVDIEARLAETATIIAGIEARAPAQQRTATAAIAAAKGNPALAGDAEVERSRFEALFLPLSIEEHRLDVLADDVAGHAGQEIVAPRITALRSRIAALQALRIALPE